MTIAVFSDFDDTATTGNVAHMLLRHFAGTKRFEELRMSFIEGCITFREYQERSFSSTSGSIADMQAVVRNNVSLRSGFHSLVSACNRKGIKFALVSSGFRFYVEPLMEREGLQDIEVIAGYAFRDGSSSGSMDFSYPYTDKQCKGDWGVCKCKAVQSAGSRTIVFIGDGATADACVAGKASIVFARGALLEKCRSLGIYAHAFETLDTVGAFINEMAI